MKRISLASILANALEQTRELPLESIHLRMLTHSRISWNVAGVTHIRDVSFFAGFPFLFPSILAYHEVMRALLLSMVLAAGLFADETPIPVVGQPTPFFGAAGRGVTASARVEPTSLIRDESCVLTLTISKLLNAASLRRPAFEELGDFSNDFQAENLPDDAAPPGQRMFRYRLRPRREGNLEIPVIAFPYYDPSIPQPEETPGLPFRKARTESIPITVTKPAGPPAIPPAPLDIPSFAENLDDPPPPWPTPGKTYLVLGLIQLFFAGLLFLLWRSGWRSRRRESGRLVRQLEGARSLEELAQAARQCRPSASVNEEAWARWFARLDEERYAPGVSTAIEELRAAAVKLTRTEEAQS